MSIWSQLRKFWELFSSRLYIWPAWLDLGWTDVGFDCEQDSIYPSDGTRQATLLPQLRPNVFFASGRSELWPP